MDDATGVLDDALVTWIREVTGAVGVQAERRSGGASRAGYAVDAVHADGRTEQLWLRMDTGFGPQSGGHYSVRREGAVYRALASTPVRVARLRAIHPTLDAFLAERLTGRNWFAQITDPAEQESTARDFMAQLAAVHALDPRALGIEELGAPGTIAAHVLEELAIWEAQYREGGATEPTISLAFAWLRGNLPPDGDWPVVLVQGDTGPGNFLYADGRVVAVMDWEMAHWGDLHDDFGWLCVRDAQERFTHLPDRFRDYVAAGGRPLDPDRLRYFRVLAQTRCAVGTRRGLLMRDARGEIANHLIFSTMHLRLLADALAEATGASTARVPPPATASAPSADAWLLDIALDDLRDVIVPALGAGFAQQRAKGLARLLKYVRRADELRAWAEDAERADLATLLGDAAASAPREDRRAALCRAIEEGGLALDDAIAFCIRDTGRAIEVARDAMGALADRTYSPID